MKPQPRYADPIRARSGARLYRAVSDSGRRYSLLADADREAFGRVSRWLRSSGCRRARVERLADFGWLALGAVVAV